jgi:hypothetical protein
MFREDLSSLREPYSPIHPLPWPQQVAKHRAGCWDAPPRRHTANETLSPAGRRRHGPSTSGRRPPPPPPPPPPRSEGSVAGSTGISRPPPPHQRRAARRRRSLVAAARPRPMRRESPAGHLSPRFLPAAPSRPRRPGRRLPRRTDFIGCCCDWPAPVPRPAHSSPLPPPTPLRASDPAPRFGRSVDACASSADAARRYCAGRADRRRFRAAARRHPPRSRSRVGVPAAGRRTARARRATFGQFLRPLSPGPGPAQALSPGPGPALRALRRRPMYTWRRPKSGLRNL